MLNNVTKCVTQKLHLKKSHFLPLQEYSVVSLWPKNQSSISYGFFVVMIDKMFLLNLLSVRLDKLSK